MREEELVILVKCEISEAFAFISILLDECQLLKQRERERMKERQLTS